MHPMAQAFRAGGLLSGTRLRRYRHVAAKLLHFGLKRRSNTFRPERMRNTLDAKDSKSTPHDGPGNVLWFQIHDVGLARGGELVNRT